MISFAPNFPYQKHHAFCCCCSLSHTRGSLTFASWLRLCSTTWVTPCYSFHLESCCVAVSRAAHSRSVAALLDNVCATSCVHFVCAVSVLSSCILLRCCLSTSVHSCSRAGCSAQQRERLCVSWWCSPCHLFFCESVAQADTDSGHRRTLDSSSQHVVITTPPWLWSQKPANRHADSLSVVNTTSFTCEREHRQKKAFHIKSRLVAKVAKTGLSHYAGLYHRSILLEPRHYCSPCPHACSVAAPCKRTP